MIRFLRRDRDKSGTVKTPYITDIHSHLLPGIDDGAPTIDDSIRLIEGLQNLGYRQAITTPHIMNDFYRNTPEIIHQKLNEVRNALADKGIDFRIEAAAEYYFDDWFTGQLGQGKKLLSFGQGHLLFELSFMNEPPQLKEAIFQMNLAGYKPVLAHPERYLFYQENFEKVEQLEDMGVLLQLNINSLSGYYSKGAQKTAELLVQKGMISFAGTDCHTLKHLEALKMSMNTKAYTKLVSQKLLNDLLI